MGATLLIQFVLIGFVFLCMCGVGSFFVSLLLGKESYRTPFSFFFVGFFISMTYLQIFHLFHPVDLLAVIPILYFGSMGVYKNPKVSFFLSCFSHKKIKLVFFALLLFGFLFISNRAIGPISNSDTHLYHLTSIRWAREYAIVPGLGLLHGRLAFNSIFFLYAAIFDVFCYGYSQHFASLLLLMLFFSRIVYSFFVVSLKKSGKRTYSDLFFVLSLFPFMRELFGKNVSSPTPDILCFIFGFFLVAELMDLFSPSTKESTFKIRALTIVSIATAGILSKLSFAALGGGSILLVFFKFVLIQNKSNRIKMIFFMIKLFALLSVSYGVWCYRSFVLSGYIAYPLSIGGFNVEWRIPLEDVKNMQCWIKSWARKPYVHWNNVLGSSEWILPWFKRLIASAQFFVPASIFLFSSITFFAKKRFKTQVACYQYLVLLPIISGLIYWFLSAPDIRFAGAQFWVLGLVFCSWLLKDVELSRKVLILFVLIICFGVVSDNNNRYIRYCLRGDYDKAARVYRPILFKHEFPSKKDYKTNEFVTDSGLSLVVPVKGATLGDAPLPCTPYPNKRLSLRKDDDLRHGFKLN